MKKVFFAALIVFSAILSSNTEASAQVKDSKNKEASMTSKEGVKIPFTIAEHYFSNKNVVQEEHMRIDSQTEFDKFFGTASTMGSLPTEIDFAKQSVLAMILKETFHDTLLTPIAIMKRSNGDLELNFSKKVSKEKLSYSSIPILIIIVDKAQAGSGKMTINQI